MVDSDQTLAGGKPNPIDLDLRVLPLEAELSSVISEALALAASVVLDRLHGTRSNAPAIVHGGGTKQEAVLHLVEVDEQARATYADPQEATEEGAEGVAILTARRVLDRIVFRRLPKGTGADYLMRSPQEKEGDGYERLECSGIGEGQESATTRLRSKIAQLARYPDGQPGYAVVTSFREEPVEIRFERWSK